ncbi:MAG: hypothetical protein RRA94_05995, partial [Bacteroidota bacterium]|nr:hypothetical protein [Bacteroidota bacterium]
EAIIGNGLAARSIGHGLATILILVIAVHNGGLARGMALTTFVFFLFAATVHPWYIAWLALLLPLYPRWSFIALIATMSVANYSGVYYHLSGDWTDPLWMKLAVYLPPLLLLLLEWRGTLPLPEEDESDSLRVGSASAL